MKKEKNYQGWIIGLLCLVILFQILTEFPIKIEIKDCPQCQGAKVECNCNCLNGTLQETTPFTWNWGINSTFYNITLHNFTNYNPIWVSK